MIRSLLRAMFSQTSRPGWLAFGAWVTHPCFSLNPETITESHSTPARDTPSLPSTAHRWYSVCVSLCLTHLNHTFYFELIPPNSFSVNNRNGSAGLRRGNYSAFVSLLKVLTISISHRQCVTSCSYCLCSLSEAISSMCVLCMKRNEIPLLSLSFFGSFF